MPKKSTAKKKAPAKKTSVAPLDLGSLQTALEGLAAEEKVLQGKLRSIETERNRIQRQIGRILTRLGVEHQASAKATAKKSAGSRRKAGPRYTDPERKAAIAFIQKTVKGGSSIAAAIKAYNAQAKPKGKSDVGYQTYLRWKG